MRERGPAAKVGACARSEEWQDGGEVRTFAEGGAEHVFAASAAIW